MALTPYINQNYASISFPEVIYGAEPSVLEPLLLASGFVYQPKGSLIGTPKASPGSSFFLYNSTDNTQELYGITYDDWVNTVSYAAAITPFTFTANIATTVGSISPITVGNIAGSNSLDPVLASSVLTGVNVNTAGLTIGAAITGAGLPANSTIIQILSANAILISGNVTATTTGVTLTSYSAPVSQGLVNVAICQANTTQWIQSALVGVNGNTDIVTYVGANQTLARSLNRYNGAVTIPVVTFKFIGGN